MKSKANIVDYLLIKQSNCRVFDVFLQKVLYVTNTRAYNIWHREDFYMKKETQKFEYVSTFAFGVLVALFVFAVFTNALIMLSPTLESLGFPAAGTIGMLFNYSSNVGHPMKMLAQVLCNLVAYAFILAAIVITVLSFVLIKHNKKVRNKCALLGCALLVPAVLGCTGGVIDFFAHGFVVLSDVAQFQYKVDNIYAPQSEATLRFDDPALDIDWRIAPEEMLMSDKDLKGRSLKELTPDFLGF